MGPRAPRLWSSDKEVSTAPSPHVSEAGAGLFTTADLSVQVAPRARPGADRSCQRT